MTSFRGVLTLDFFSYSNFNNFLPLNLIFCNSWISTVFLSLFLLLSFTLNAMFYFFMLVLFVKFRHFTFFSIASPICGSATHLSFIYFFDYKFFSVYYFVLFCGFLVLHFNAAWLLAAADETAVFFSIFSGW